MRELVDQVTKWGKDKGINKKENSFKQLAKFLEEAGEVAGALARDDRPELEDGIGDTIVTLIILADQQGMDIENCLQTAYDVISKRKGETIDGIFYKQEDLDSMNESLFDDRYGSSAKISKVKGSIEFSEKEKEFIEQHPFTNTDVFNND